MPLDDRDSMNSEHLRDDSSPKGRPRAVRPDARGRVAIDPRGMGAEIVDRCIRLGFVAAGIAVAEPSRWQNELKAWVEAGRHGEMDYFLDELDVRLDPAKLLKGTKAFVMVADAYASRNGGREQESLQSEADSHAGEPESLGRIARYARGRDYHTVMKVRLHALADQLRLDYPGSEFRSFVDTAPVLERELAAAAGLGWQAKNTMMIHPRHGSYLLLGGMATTLALEPPPEQRISEDHCGTCTRCIDACPTGAITPYSVDGTRCISYLTIEHRSAIPTSLHEPIGDWLYGCDVCQEVCPHNSPRESREGRDVLEAYAPRASAFSLLEVLGWTAAQRESAILGSAMKRATLEMMKRNALICAGNSLRTRANAALLERVREAAQSDPSEIVRETARVVLISLDCRT